MVVLCTVDSHQMIESFSRQHEQLDHGRSSWEMRADSFFSRSMFGWSQDYLLSTFFPTTSTKTFQRLGHGLVPRIRP